MSIKQLQDTTIHHDNLNLRCNDLTVDGTFTHSGGGGGSSFVDIQVSGNIKRTVGAVTQASNITTAVTINAPTGMITTVDTTPAGIPSGGQASFLVNNSFVKADSIVIACLSGHYDVLSGLPVIQVNQTVDGNFKIVVGNAHPTNTLGGSLTINFNVIDKI